jgi:hypothetical protein
MCPTGYIVPIMHGGFLYAMGIRSEEEAYGRVVFDSQRKIGD